MLVDRMRKSIWSPEQKVFAGVLRQAREAARLTQVELAERLGETQPFVSSYETGQRRLDFLELREICRVLGIPLSEFVRTFEERVRSPS